MLANSVNPRGFRPGSKGALSVSYSVIKDDLSRGLRGNVSTAAIIIALWADAERELIYTLREALREVGIVLPDTWSWEIGMQGFYDLDHLESVIAVVDKITPSDDDFTRWKYYLASLWLSSGIDLSDGGSAPELIDLPAAMEEVTGDESVQEPIANNLEVHELTLAELDDRLLTAIHNLEEYLKNARAVLRDIDATLDASPVQNVISATIELHRFLAGYQDEETRLLSGLQDSIYYLRPELAARPDLRTDFVELIETIDRSAIPPVRAAAEIVAIIEKLGEYDRERNTTLLECQKFHDHIMNLHLQLGEYVSEDEAEELGDLAKPTTLTDARKRLSNLQRLDQQLSDRVELKHKDYLDQIVEMAEFLKHIPNLPLLHGFSWEDLSNERLSSQSLDNLAVLLSQLNEVREQVKRRFETPVKLPQDPSSQDFTNALNMLAEQNRDVEVLLLLLCGYVSREMEFDLELSDAAVDSLIQGIKKLSGEESAFYLFNNVAPLLLNKWNAVGTYSSAAIQMMIIAADCTRKRLPQGTAWQFPVQQWALNNTPLWLRLWETVLQSEGIPHLSEEIAFEEVLQAKRRAAEQSLIKENGRYSRASGMKSARHSAMLGNHLFPELDTYLLSFVRIGEDLLLYPDDQLEWQWARQEKEVRRLLDFFADDNLISRYEAQVAIEGIHDTQPFHRDKATKLYFDCAQHVAKYGYALIEVAEQRLNQLGQISRQGLLMEIEPYSALQPLATEVIEQLSLLSETTNLPWADPLQSTEQARFRIIESILTGPEYGVQLPHLIVSLVNEHNGFSDWYPALLEDIVGEQEVAASAQLLLDGNAPNQVLLSAKFPREFHVLAQETQGRLAKIIAQLESELMGFGGEIEDLRNLHKTGRWSVLERELVSRIDVVKEKQQIERINAQTQIVSLMTKVNELEMSVVTNNEIPSNIKQLLQRGFSIARTAITGRDVFGGISDFLKNVSYRMERQAWNLSEVQLAINRLQEDPEGKPTPVKSLLTAEEVLRHLDRNELAQLGFSEDQIQLSSVETRCHVLENWLKVRDINSFSTIDMTMKDRAAIWDLYRYFARMTTMEQVKSPSGEHIRDESVSPYGLYQLRYPKTEILDNACVFITLSGDKPKAKDRQALHELIDGRDWLPDRFVIVFIPGCTPQLKSALENEYQKRGLIVIDETAVIGMVLAESYGNKPIGKLRSLMLNSKPLQHIDIFKINQLVEPRKSIFVGREDLIQQISTSGDNYALYGGRRIGKSSVLSAVRDSLIKREIKTVYFSFEGREDCADDRSAGALARELQTQLMVHTVDELRSAIETHMDENPDERIVVLLDEIDKYIDHNPKRHLLIETLRSLSERYKDRFRVIVAGFMRLYDCMKLRGPYTPTSDPWKRMFRDKLLENLTAESAESIVREGFIDILGWEFQHRAIPQEVVVRTGGHPAFVQKFCEKIQQLVAKRNDKKVMLADLETIFEDTDPEDSFIAYVRSTLVMNLDPVARFVVLWLAKSSEDLKSFRIEQLKDYANLLDIPDDVLVRSIEHLLATSVIRQLVVGLYEFTVPDYPLILSKLGDINYSFEELEEDVRHYLVHIGQA